jgi:hypothetical protein
MFLRARQSLRSVSVLVPCFNSAAFIAETLESLLEQTYTPAEIIVVDDGSSDGSQDIIRRYRSSGVSLIQQRNCGAGSARNKALEASTGTHLLFLDSDDIVGPTHLEALLDATSRETDVAFGRWDRFREKIDEALFPPRVTDVTMPGPQWVIRDWNYVNMTQCGMFLIPRSIMSKVGGWNEVLSRGPNDDFEFFARVLCHARFACFADGARLFYRSGVGGSLSSRRGREAIQAKYLSLSLGTSHLLKSLNSAEARRACADKFQGFVYDHYPVHEDLLQSASQRVRELGGSQLVASGPPGFEALRPLIGWRLARRVQLIAERNRWNGASRSKRNSGPSDSRSKWDEF